MKSVRALAGMNVVCGDRRIGRVAQVRLSDDLIRMDGLWVDTGLRGSRYICAEHISMLGSVAILADCSGVRRRIARRSLFRRAVSTDGRRLGAIVDAMVNEISFSVDALILTRGFWDDLTRGRCLVTHFSTDPSTDSVVLYDEDLHERSDMTCEAE